MRRLDVKTAETMRTATILVLLDLRAAYLANGASPLRHWDQVLDRMRAATRTTSTVEEWHTTMLRGLQLGAPSSSACSRLLELVSVVAGDRAAWLDLIERESGYLLAAARLESERRRDERAAKMSETIETLEGE